MLRPVIEKLSFNSRKIKKLNKLATEIQTESESIKNASLEELSVKYKSLQLQAKRLLASADILATADSKFLSKKNLINHDLIVRSFAICSVLMEKTKGMKPYFVQVVGGLALVEGFISEMQTGEGKTLVATFPAFYYSLFKRQVHVITANEYLAKRDAEYVKPIFDAIGVSVASNISNSDKQEVYASDVIYSTQSEIGFDYLKDNLVRSKEDKLQSGLFVAIIDEVDSILIDEARTPLIISAPDSISSEPIVAQNIVNALKSFLAETNSKSLEDFLDINLGKKTLVATELFYNFAEQYIQSQHPEFSSEMADLYHEKGMPILFAIQAALNANFLYRKDVDYVVSLEEIIIVDEQTGRLAIGRRWGDGLHQALEVKEGLPLKAESVTLASITYQSFFKLYTVLCGMTGTASTEKVEFFETYGLEVLPIPTNKPKMRLDHPDLLYRSKNEKFKAIVDRVVESHKKGQPILIGTTSIESSEYLSELLSAKNLPHKVLNAKFHDIESEIISDAGKPFSITIATNMAGRGTDILLGGDLSRKLASHDKSDSVVISDVKDTHDEEVAQVINAGGLLVIGTDRNDSRRIDNQLIGRSGRQGDVGETQYYLSFEDQLLKSFGDKGIVRLLLNGLSDGDSISGSAVDSLVLKAQKQLEGHNYDIRKQLRDYDQFINEQRLTYYKIRDSILDSKQESSEPTVLFSGLESLISDIFKESNISNSTLSEEQDQAKLTEFLSKTKGLDLDAVKPILENIDSGKADLAKTELFELIKAAYLAKWKTFPIESIVSIEHDVLLDQLDSAWRQNMIHAEYTKKFIHLRANAQKDPKQEFKFEVARFFNESMSLAFTNSYMILLGIEITIAEPENEEQKVEHQDSVITDSEELTTISTEISEMDKLSADAASDQLQPTASNDQFKKRNDPCSCGSGLRFKHCCGKLD